MGQISISSKFSGGPGAIQIMFPETGTSFDLSSESSQAITLNLPQGAHSIEVGGFASNQGGVDLKISGDIPSELTMSFGGGTIPVNNSVVFVNK